MEPYTAGEWVVAAWPSVTVVVVTLLPEGHLDRCLSSLAGLDYPADRFNVVVVDNGSATDVRSIVGNRGTVIRNDGNVGFAPAVNQAVRASQDDLIALVNDDATVEPDWLTELVLPLRNREAIKVTGGLVLDPDGEVEFAGGALTWYGHGIPLPANATDGAPAPVAFATGSSMAVKRDWWDEVGGFDDDYFAYFEDVDLGWRTWLAGGEVWFVPTARSTHIGHATAARFGDERRRYLLERNALATIYKNFGEEALGNTLPAATLMVLARGFADGDLHLGDYSIDAVASAAHVETEGLSIDAMAAAHLAALRDFMAGLETWNAKRAVVQAKRLRDDRQLVRLFRLPMTPNIADPTFLRAYEQVTQTFEVLLHATSRQRVLIVTADTIGERMAGPAIRTWEMARLLSLEHEVRLATTHVPGRSHEAFDVVHLDPSTIDELAAWAEVTIVQGPTTHAYPHLLRGEGCVVVDLYDPYHLENLVQRRHDVPDERWTTARVDRQILEDQLLRGDMFLCANDRQRDLWLGQLAALGRINPATYDHHPDLSGLLALAPFGLPDVPPEPVGRPLRDRFGLDDDDVVLLWGGGIWNWFDPATLLRGLALAIEQAPQLKLVFLGTARPNPDVPEMARAGEARRVADELGLEGKSVFFNEGWVPYEERGAWLLDADIGVTTHFQHIETQYAFRTRVLDYLWAGLPILSTTGDGLSDLVRTRGLGEVVAPEDAEAVAAALLALADGDRRREARANIAELAPDLTWERALEPLLSYCRMPRRAPDTDAPRAHRHGTVGAYLRRNPVDLARRFAEVTRERGLSAALQAVRNSVRARISARRRPR